jgi:hypothetical protein
MSLNKALNATVALIEGNTNIAKEILRDPSSDVRDGSAIMYRLNRAVDRAAARAIRNALVRCLAIQSTPQTRSSTPNPEYDKAFFAGVKATEDIMNTVVEELEDLAPND